MALQTKTFSIGSFDRYNGTSNGYILDLILTEESTDLQANTSLVSYKLQMRSGPSNRFDWEFTSTLALNGAQVAASTAEKYLDYNSTWVLLEGQATIAHNANGALDMPFSAVVTPWNGGTQYTPPELTLSGTMAMTAIARASTIAASSAYIEETSTVVVSRKNNGYTHSIRYEFGGLTGYLADAVGTHSDAEVKLTDTTILFPVPASFYAQIPNAPSGVCTLTCTTYSGDTQIGEPQTAAFTATAAALRCAPVISGTAVDANSAATALTGKNTIFISGISDVLCTVSASAKNGATIKARYVNGKEITGTSLTITDIDTASVVLRAVDSRGYSAEYTVPGLSIVPYVPISGTVQAKRDDPTSGKATLTVTGKWYNGSFGSQSNALACRYRVNGGSWVSAAVTVDGENFTIQVALSGLNYQSSHTIDVQVTDKLNTLSKSVTVNKGIPVFDWGENDFFFHVPVKFTAADGTVFTLEDIDGGFSPVIEITPIDNGYRLTITDVNGTKTIDILNGVADGAVLYKAAQSLTEAQKARARTNINALDGNFEQTIERLVEDVEALGGGSAVRFDEEQSLTSTEQARARRNIGAQGINTLTLEFKDQFGESISDFSIEPYYPITDDNGEAIKGVLEFYETNGDLPVVLSNIADGEADSDAATVGQVKAMMGDMIVTSDGTTASHTPSEISAHVQNGGNAVWDRYGDGAMLVKLESYSESHACFTYTVLEEYISAQLLIYEDGSCEEFDGDFASSSTVDHKITRPSQATVGQTIAAKTIDSNGRPTAWVAADLPVVVKLITNDGEVTYTNYNTVYNDGISYGDNVGEYMHKALVVYQKPVIALLQDGSAPIYRTALCWCEQDMVYVSLDGGNSGWSCDPQRDPTLFTEF